MVSTLGSPGGAAASGPGSLLGLSSSSPHSRQLMWSFGVVGLLCVVLFLVLEQRRSGFASGYPAVSDGGGIVGAKVKPIVDAPPRVRASASGSGAVGAHPPALDGALGAFWGNVSELAGQGGIYIYPMVSGGADGGGGLLPPGGSLFPISGGEGVKFGDQYALESVLLRLLQDSPYVTRDPASARLFFVPQFATHESLMCLGPPFGMDSASLARLRACAADVSRDYLLPIIARVQATPWYRRRGGRDHLWAFPWDSGWDIFPGVAAALASNKYWGYFGPPANLVAVPVVAAPALTERPYEDAAVRNIFRGGTQAEAFAKERLGAPWPWAESAAAEPAGARRGDGAEGQGGSAAPPPPAAAAAKAEGGGRECLDVRPPHTYLASFSGTIFDDRTYSHGVRQDLLAHFPEERANETGILVVKRHVGAAYAPLLRDSLFCLSPQGWTPWSQRLYSILAAGCIPVFFDMPDFNAVLPHSEVLPWRDMSVTLPVAQLPRLREVLLAVPPARICAMRRNLAVAGPFITWSQAPHMALLAALHGAHIAVKRSLANEEEAQA